MESNGEYLQEQERLLIERASKGDQKAFSELFFKYKEMVYRVVYRLLGNSEETYDAVQQTFIELYKSLPGYAGKSKFTTWLYRIAVNVSIQFFRKRRSHEKTQTLDPELLADSTAEKESSIEKKELRKQIEQALASLHIRKRTVVILHDIENRTMEEISAIIGVPVGTIKSRLFYGREELRKKLDRLLD
ncbi:MAG: sigma-70 family RNA polymerase sigma factor [Chitinispirillaceae bacterium]|nr:sigma-70 family RNA polymerase sigma factor [Chitinispirillaceae bacterium]